MQEKHLSIESTNIHGQDEEFQMLAETKILPGTSVSGKSVILQKIWLTPQKIGKRLPRVVGSSPLKRKESREVAPPRAQSICQGEKRGSINPLGHRMRHILAPGTITPALLSSGLRKPRSGSKTRLSYREELRTCTKLWRCTRSFYTGKGLFQPRKLPGQFNVCCIFHVFQRDTNSDMLPLGHLLE